MIRGPALVLRSASSTIWLSIAEMVASGAIPNRYGPWPFTVAGVTSRPSSSGPTSGNVQRSPDENPGGAPTEQAATASKLHANALYLIESSLAALRVGSRM